MPGRSLSPGGLATFHCIGALCPAALHETALGERHYVRLESLSQRPSCSFDSANHINSDTLVTLKTISKAFLEDVELQQIESEIRVHAESCSRALHLTLYAAFETASPIILVLEHAASVPSNLDIWPLLPVAPRSAVASPLLNRSSREAPGRLRRKALTQSPPSRPPVADLECLDAKYSSAAGGAASATYQVRPDRGLNLVPENTVLAQEGPSSCTAPSPLLRRAVRHGRRHSLEDRTSCHWAGQVDALYRDGRTSSTPKMDKTRTDGTDVLSGAASEGRIPVAARTNMGIGRHSRSPQTRNTLHRQPRSGSGSPVGSGSSRTTGADDTCTAAQPRSLHAQRSRMGPKVPPAPRAQRGLFLAHATPSTGCGQSAAVAGLPPTHPTVPQLYFGPSATAPVRTGPKQCHDNFTPFWTPSTVSTAAVVIEDAGAVASYSQAVAPSCAAAAAAGAPPCRSVGRPDEVQVHPQQQTGAGKSGHFFFAFGHQQAARRQEPKFDILSKTFPGTFRKGRQQDRRVGPGPAELAASVTVPPTTRQTWNGQSLPPILTDDSKTRGRFSVRLFSVLGRLFSRRSLANASDSAPVLR